MAGYLKKGHIMNWLPLKPGDGIDIIAPAGRYDESLLPKIETLLSSWHLKPLFKQPLLGDDLLCANSDKARLEALKHALYDSRSQAIWCIRGGYGCTRLLPALAELTPPEHCKLFMGFSDITALHIFLNQQWQWPTLHAPSLTQVVNQSIHANHIAALKALILGQHSTLSFDNLQPMNPAARESKILHSTVIGGNLCLIQTSLGTPWQIDTQNKILLLEEVNEAPYKVDRMLEHLQQAGILKHCTAILLGDFVIKNQRDKTVERVLEHFANAVEIPVLRCLAIGHGNANHPIPLGTPAELTLGTQCSLSLQANA